MWDSSFVSMTPNIRIHFNGSFKPVDVLRICATRQSKKYPSGMHPVAFTSMHIDAKYCHKKNSDERKHTNTRERARKIH